MSLQESSAPSHAPISQVSVRRSDEIIVTWGFFIPMVVSIAWFVHKGSRRCCGADCAEVVLDEREEPLQEQTTSNPQCDDFELPKLELPRVESFIATDPVDEIRSLSSSFWIQESLVDSEIDMGYRHLEEGHQPP